MNKQKPTVTIGIPAYNEESNIKNLLKELLRQKLSAFKLASVIVASDGSTDETVPEAKNIGSSKVVVIDGKKRWGKPYRLNQISSRAGSDVLVIIDADTKIYDRTFLEKLIKPIIVSGKDLTSARVMETASVTFVQKLLAASMNFKRFVFEHYKKGNNLYTCHGRSRAFSKKFYQALKFNDTIADDAYSYLFCKIHGFKYMFVKNAVIYYNLPESLPDHQKQSLRFFRAKQDLKKVFNENLVEKEYRLPKSLLLLSALKQSLKNPYLLMYFFTAAILYFKSKFIEQPKVTWSAAVSSKGVKS